MSSSHELGYSRHSRASKQDSNCRNGTRERGEETIIDDSGQKIVIGYTKRQRQ